MASGEKQSEVQRPMLVDDVKPDPILKPFPDKNTATLHWEEGDAIEGGDTKQLPIQLNQTDTTFPIVRLRRYNDTSPEEMMIFFDQTSRHAYRFLEDAMENVKHRLACTIMPTIATIMPDITTASWEKKSDAQKWGLVESRFKDFFLPEREGQEFRLASFVVHPKANFYDENGELISKAQFKANYTESDQASEYTYKVVVDISRVVCTKQKNLKVKAFVVAAKPVHDPNRKQAQEYNEEAPEVWVTFADEPAAKAQKT